MSELKAVLAITTTCLHISWKTSMPLMHSCSNDGVIQLGPLSSDGCLRSLRSVMHVLYTFSWGSHQSHLIASFLDPADPSIQTASRSSQPFIHNELDKCLSSHENIILMTSDLHNYYVVLYKYWWYFLYFFQLTDMSTWIVPRNCENLLNFVKLMPKILLVHFFSDTVYLDVHTHHTHTTVLRLYGFCLGQPGWASTRRNIHRLTLIVVINYPYLLSPSTTIHGILPIQSTCFTV